MEELLIGTSSFPQHWVSRMLARFLKNARGGVAPSWPSSLSLSWPRLEWPSITRGSMPPALRSRFPWTRPPDAFKGCRNRNEEALQTEATKTFNSLFSRSEVTDVNVTPLYTSAGGSKLTLNGTAVAPYEFPRRYRHRSRRYQIGVGFELGQHASARSAGARQHRIYGE